MQLRPYQQATLDAIHWYFQNASGNPVVELPTGSGKSLVQAELIRCLLAVGEQRILCLTHVKELIAQNHAELLSLWPMAPAGIYSASLNQRDTREPVIFAGIQSVHHRSAELGRFDWIIVDECHLVPTQGSGIYRKFLDMMLSINPNLKVIGLSATPYRLSGGLLVDGKDRIFTDLISAQKTGATVRHLINAGHLAPLVTPQDKLPRLDVSKVGQSDGEFKQHELSQAIEHQASVTSMACREIARRGRDRKKWIVFGTSVEHCYQIQQQLDVPSMVIHAQSTGFERESYIRQFRQGQLRALISVNVLSTGFNVPEIDLLAMLRPTASASLYVQQAGRGMRTAPNKQNCLVLDFAGNIDRHGPVDNVHPPERRRQKGDVPMKACQECVMLVPAIAPVCRFCGFEFFTSEGSNLADIASNSRILDLEQSYVRYQQVTATYAIEQRPEQPDVIRVDYFQEGSSQEGSSQKRKVLASNWICPLHSGYEGLDAEKWFVEFCDYFGAFKNIVDALDIARELAVAPDYIVVDESRRPPRMVEVGQPLRRLNPVML